MPRSPAPLPAVPPGWIILSARRRYTVGYWLLLVLGSLFDFGPSAADMHYRLRYEPDGSIHTIELPGDAAPGALAETLRLIETG